MRRYAQKGHPTLATLVDLNLQPRKFKVLLAIGLHRLSSLQTTLWYIALVYSFLFPLEGFEKS